MNLDKGRILHLLPEPALLVSGAGSILVANAAFGQLVSRPANDLVGSRLTEAVADPPEKILEYLRNCSRSRQPIPGGIRWRLADGSCAELRCSGAVVIPRTDEAEAVLFLRSRIRSKATERFTALNEKIAALSKEVHERVRAEEERDQLLASERAARADAERIGRLKDEFLATLSHELRTPINAILGWAHILRRQGNDPGEMAEGMRVIERNARVQAQLIEDLLDMSRIISGKLRLDVQRVDPSVIIESAIASVRPSAEAKDIRIQMVLDPMAGPVKGDPNRLQQVVWNLLSNAIKFTPKGGRVQIFLERVNSHVELTVSDTGIGIKREFLPHVFDRFRQADSTSTRHYGGLGLGLAIVRHLVEMHGGTVRVKSAGEGQGATFIVALPVTVAREDPSAGRNEGAGDQGGSELDCPSLQGVKVVVLDDEADARDLIRRLLEGCEAIVFTVESGEEAIRSIAREHPDVFVSDLGMPSEDGYAVLRRLRKLPREQGGDVPAIALTAFARSEDRRRALLAGFQMHLAKPVEPSELIAVVASLSGRTSRDTGA